MTRTRSFRSLVVTGILPEGVAIPGLTVDSAAELAAFLLPGERITDGVTVESGWSMLVCETCGSEAHWCPDMMAHLPVEWVNAQRAAEQAA